MPSWPMAMPSSTATVLISCPATPPAASIPRHQLPHVLQVDVAGRTNWVKLLTTAMMGLQIGILHAGGAPQGARTRQQLRPAVEVLER